MKHEFERSKFSIRDDGIDTFAYESGYHNGPRCINCKKEFCHHCTPGCYEEECPGFQFAGSLV